MDAAEQLEALERAVQEVEALDAIYGYDEGGFTIHSEAELLAAQAAVESAELAAGAAPQLDIELQIELDEDDDGSDAPAVPTKARLRCSLPPGYPLICAAVSVSVEGLRRASADELSAKLTDKAAELAGGEAVSELVQELQEIAPAVVAGERAAKLAASTKPSEPGEAPAQFGRRWITAQTVTKRPNRQMAVVWANDLELGGFLKPGSPGIFVFEGEASACDTFIHQLRNVQNSCLRALSVRGAVSMALSSDDTTGAAVDAQRKLPRPFVDLDVCAMGVLSAKANEAGLDEEFREFILGRRASKPAESVEPEPEAGSELIFCTFHHLLAGKSHTKETEMVGEAKSLGLAGLIVYGTPGIVVLRKAEGGDDEREFMTAARKIGKKGEVTLRLAVSAHMQTTAPELAEFLGGRGSRGLRVASSVGLKALIEGVGAAGHCRSVLGLRE